ncbi:glycosyltransferase involved in cell wall biosynthesis [Paenibacillus cellulosilyticus]|uniref:Glycosyltransferase involved in cell wall biosynthesis n=1 Tax=Paenibacillus cellulosilyticus TaxID=375489 RepID=A0A2V2Z0T7_9BACL|nr:glycosyltransferase [Paenibacillus cellulosilyticus]PWW08477.1 glycosyltransferase involved in cell wall biosynthesis [Paenibacillus cellulosilyticus]QKS48062.1 glycosyltransferase family 4 protein [Paenibacillus cellulosilyticus]
MKLLVIQEQHFKQLPNREVWVDEQSNIKFWERYLNVYEEICVCARLMHVDSIDESKYMRSDRDRVHFAGLPNFRGVGGLIKNLFKVISIMKAQIEQSDCIIFRAPSPISMIAYPLVKRSKKPFAVEIMNNPATHFSKKAMQNFYQPIITYLMVRQTRSMCLSANGVSYVTDRVLQELYPSKARIQGQSTNYFESSYSTIRLEDSNYRFEEWKEDLPPKVMLIHTGKMQDNRKGQDIFIKAISILRKKGFNIGGILVGDGVKRSEFEQLGKDLGIGDDLDFVGWKAGFEAVQKELIKSHIAVFPSMGEGLPRAVIEAMANGLLCIGSKVDGLCELLDEDLLVPELNEDSFALYIEKFLNNWGTVESKRRHLYEISKKYHNNILKQKRNGFYSKLKSLGKK